MDFLLFLGATPIEKLPAQTFGKYQTVLLTGWELRGQCFKPSHP